MVNNIVNGKLLTRQNYNLGAFDTVDTSNANYDLITRQTGYIDNDYIANNFVRQSYWWSAIGICILINEKDEVYDNLLNNTTINIPVSKVPYSSITTADSNLEDGVLYFAVSNDQGQIALRKKGITTVADFVAYLNSLGIINLQYKSKTINYTEKVIKNQPINTLDQNASQWVRNEWEKGLQLWNETTRGGYFDSLGNYKSANNQLCSCMISVKPNTTYTLSGWNSGNICFFQQNGTFIRRDSPVNTFTTPSNCYYISLSFGTDYGTTYNHDIMLNEGTHAYPYVPYYGSIARQDQVLLWENSSPTSAFSAQNVSFNTSANNFKYIVFAFKITQAATQGIQTLKCFVPSSLSSNVSFFLGCFDDTSSMTYRRLFTMTSYTGGTFSSGYNQSGSNTNDYICVPVAIYGTNVL